jgi:hypothetical protein
MIVYQQIPKTATTHTVEILRHNFTNQKFEHEHYPMEEIPKELDTIFATIRNPLSWYLSAWSGELVRHLDYLYVNNEDPRYFRTFVAELDNYDTKQRIGEGFDSKEYGLYSHYVQKYLFYKDEQVVHNIVRLENYEEDLEKVIGPYREPFEKKQNVSQRKLADSEYFNDETIERIINNDKRMATHLGYDYG